MTEPLDIVVLRTPRGDGALPVMRVVMGGVASRLGLPIEGLDDIQLAVEALVAEEAEEGEQLVLTLSASTVGVRVELGGLQNQALRSVLTATDPFSPCDGCRLDVRVLLDALVDTYRIIGKAGDSFAVEMEKRAS